MSEEYTTLLSHVEQQTVWEMTKAHMVAHKSRFGEAFCFAFLAVALEQSILQGVIFPFDEGTSGELSLAGEAWRVRWWIGENSSISHSSAHAFFRGSTAQRSGTPGQKIYNLGTDTRAMDFARTRVVSVREFKAAHEFKVEFLKAMSEYAYVCAQLASGATISSSGLPKIGEASIRRREDTGWVLSWREGLG